MAWRVAVIGGGGKGEGRLTDTVWRSDGNGLTMTIVVTSRHTASQLAVRELCVCDSVTS